MAVEHIVWIRFREGVTDARIEEHLAGLRSLTDRVPGIVALKLGANFTDRAGGYTHGLVVTFRDEAGLDAYLPHPEHVQVAGPLKNDADLMAMDFEW